MTMRRKKVDKATMVADALRLFSKADGVLVGCADIAQWMNGMGFRAFRGGHLISAQLISQWSRKGLLPTKGGARHRLSTTWHTLLAWVCTDQRCVRVGAALRPRTDQPQG